MKDWTKLVLSLHHTNGHGTIEISWDEAADDFRVDLVHSAEEMPPDMIHMNPEKCIAYGVHALYDAFQKLMPRRHVDRIIAMMMADIAGGRLPADAN
jgi:hypothetical protein